MAKEKKVGTLKPGNPFRDWLVDVLGERASDKKCRVEVYKIIPSSHTVCRYELQNLGLSVIGKFYAEPTGWKRNYDPVQAMYREYETLKKVENIIDIPRPLAIRKSFHCVLLTEYVQGRSLYEYMRQDYGLYDRLISIAHVLRKLHDQTKSDYKIEREFASYHKVLNQIGLDMSSRRTFDRLLGDWWYSQRLARPYGCRVHHDANPTNYLFDQGKVYVLGLREFTGECQLCARPGDCGSRAKALFCRSSRRCKQSRTLYRSFYLALQPQRIRILCHHSRPAVLYEPGNAENCKA